MYTGGNEAGVKAPSLSVRHVDYNVVVFQLPHHRG